MRRLRIGPRLTLSFAIIILLMFLGTAVGLWQFTVVQTQADLVTDAIADEQATALENMHQASALAVQSQVDYCAAVAELMRAAGISPNQANRSPGDQLLTILSAAMN